MTTPTSSSPTTSDPLEQLSQAYAPHEHRPLKGYAGAMAVYTAAVGGIGLAARLSGRQLPERLPPYDVVLLAAATHRLARTLTKDAVTSPLRAPFARYVEPSAPSEVHEEVRDEGSPVRHALGELLLCPFCLAQWVATGLVAGHVFAPRVTRLVTATMTAVAGADFLQNAYAWSQQRAEG